MYVMDISMLSTLQPQCHAEDFQADPEGSESPSRFVSRTETRKGRKKTTVKK